MIFTPMKRTEFKNTLVGLIVGFCFIGYGFHALADEVDYSQIPGMPKLDYMTGDDEWGCQVLLCLANPNGPKAVSECHPPIDRLFDCLSWRHPCKFPSCPMAGEGNYAKQLSDGFDPCVLKGLEDGPKGYLAEGDIHDESKFKTTRGNRKLLRGRSTYNYGGEHYFSDEEGNGGYWGGTKACVSGYQGTAYEAYTCRQESGDSSYTTTCYRPVKVYEKVLWQQYQSRRAIDVFIEGKNWTRVHW